MSAPNTATPTSAPPTRTMRKEISPGMFLTRKEDARDDYAVVYTLRNDTESAVYLTMDFWGSKNFRLLPETESATPVNSRKTEKVKKKKKKKSYKTRADLLRKVMVRPQACIEVARLKVDHVMLPSHLKVHYVWEASDLADAEMPPEVGKAQKHREVLAHGVFLVTKRTDSKDGHTTFVYTIDSTARRDSLMVTLDFSESENLALRAGKKGFLARVFGGKGGNDKQVPNLVKSVHLPSKTKVKRVATVRTVVPREGWSLRHKVSVEIRELVRQPLRNQGEEEEADAGSKEQIVEQTAAINNSAAPQREEDNLLEPEKPTTMTCPSTKKSRRESVLQIRSSHGFQDGFLKPPATPATAATLAAANPDLNGWIGAASKSNRSSSGGSFSSVARSSLSMLLDFVKPVVGGGSKTLRPETLPPRDPAPPPYRMSWLTAEDMGDASGNSGETSLLSIMELAAEDSSVEGEEIKGKASCGNLFELLSSVNLTCYHASFIQQAIDLTLLEGLAKDSKADFRNALKEDVRIEKFGHREAILRAVLSN